MAVLTRFRKMIIQLACTYLKVTFPILTLNTTVFNPSAGEEIFIRVNKSGRKCGRNSVFAHAQNAYYAIVLQTIFTFRLCSFVPC